MFASGRSFTHREVLDQRAWLVRIACKNPVLFPLTLMGAHLCVYSSNFKFACEEFMKAHRLAPEDPWPLLCLGANMLCLSTSRTCKERQMTVLKAFAIFAMYAKLRGNEHASEIHYNMGRAFHQLSIWGLADREYRLALDLAVAEGNKDIERVAAFNLSLIRARSENKTAQIALLKRHLVAS
jgi:general transcription factor 3C polypeptide 3 (transcription factor C subunit 4)